MIDAAEALGSACAAFALIGGVAVGHHSGVPRAEFDAMSSRAELVEVRGRSIPIVGKADLIAMKRRAASNPTRRRSKRLRDEADVALLEGDVPDPDEGW